MTVDHAGGLRPENRGAVVVPGDAVTDRHEVIVHCEQDAQQRLMNFKWLNGYVTANAGNAKFYAPHDVMHYAKLIPGGQCTARRPAVPP